MARSGDDMTYIQSIHDLVDGQTLCAIEMQIGNSRLAYVALKPHVKIIFDACGEDDDTNNKKRLHPCVSEAIVDNTKCLLRAIVEHMCALWTGYNMWILVRGGEVCAA